MRTGNSVSNSPITFLDNSLLINFPYSNVENILNPFTRNAHSTQSFISSGFCQPLNMLLIIYREEPSIGPPKRTKSLLYLKDQADYSVCRVSLKSHETACLS